MARPKGVIQARNESKYWLPEGVTLKSDQKAHYTKECKLIFIDSQHGEFTATFKALQKANDSVHPKALSIRKSLNNPGMVPGSREKARATMKERYGVELPGQSPELIAKAKKTTKERHTQEKINKVRQDTLMERYGVTNVMKVPEFRLNQELALVEAYGVNNANFVPGVSEKRMQAYIENGERSGEELELANYIESLGFKTGKGYLGGSNPREIDITIEGVDIQFEYNGVKWHHEDSGRGERNKHYHVDKTNRCEAKGVKLIQIFDREWHERNFQVKSFIRSMLGKNNIQIYARKCEIRKVSYETARDFLETYHILGKTNIQGGFGLYYNDELVSLATYNKHHRNTGEYLLNRYVTKHDVTVIGGLSRLSKAMYLEIGIFYTFIDRRFSNGISWLKCGYEKISVSGPDYFYYCRSTGRVISKQSRRKDSAGTPEWMTESEHAKLDNLSRIWDCGKIKLKYSPK